MTLLPNVIVTVTVFFPPPGPDVPGQEDASMQRSDSDGQYWFVTDDLRIDINRLSNEEALYTDSPRISFTRVSDAVRQNRKMIWAFSFSVSMIGGAT
jgi:hypothetical protein